MNLHAEVLAEASLTSPCLLLVPLWYKLICRDVGFVTETQNVYQHGMDGQSTLIMIPTYQHNMPSSPVSVWNGSVLYGNGVSMHPMQF